MKQNEIKIGNTYTAKVSDRLTKVRIDSKHSSGKGWNATNIATGKRIHIKSAQRLRSAASEPAKEAAKSDAPKPEAKAAAPKVDKSPTSKTKTKVAPVAKEAAPDATRANRGGDTAKGDAKPRPVAKSKGDAKPKRVSAIDAAVQVLQQAGAPMNTKEMIAAMHEQGLWQSPAGKTPHATLYSAILREMTTKGADARFRKVERGRFEHSGAR